MTWIDATYTGLMGFAYAGKKLKYELNERKRFCLGISASAWWQGVKDGKYPQPVKLGPRTTAWRVEKIRNLIRWAPG